MMKRAPKTPALAKLAMLLLFAIATVAILDTTSISAQELGRTITSPFGIARQTSASESGSDGDTFVDPETGEVGHIIRNPFGVANPEGVDTGIDIPDSGEEEVGGIITSPFGVPASDDIDTGVDVFEEDEEYLISLPDDEETDAEESDDVDEVDDETSDDVKELEKELAEATTEKYVPVKDNPIPGRECDTIDFSIVGICGSDSVTSSTELPDQIPTLRVPSGESFTIQAVISNGSFSSGNPTWTISSGPISPCLLSGATSLSTQNIPAGNISATFQTTGILWAKYSFSATAIADESSCTRIVNVEIYSIDLRIDSDNNGVINDLDEACETNNPGKIIGINNLDTNKNWIPDFADGFDCTDGGTTGTGKSASFTEMKMIIPSNLSISSDSNYSVKFSFTESPYTVTRTPTGMTDPQYFYSPPTTGQLRIWTKDGGEARLKATVKDSTPGHHVPNNDPIPLNKLFSGIDPVGNTRTVTLYVEAVNPSTSAGGNTITATLCQNSTEMVSDSVKTTAVKVDSVMPNETSDGSKAIKIMIETNEEAEAFAGGDRYYTSAQTEDHKVNITATITPTIRGVTVYFEVIDPDDLSPYEGKDYDTHGFTNDEEDLFANDNLDPLKSMLDEPEQEEPLEQEDPRGQGESQQEEEQPQYTAFQACLSTRSATTDEHGKATVVLDITNQYSGDNYIVRASCIDPGRIDQVKLRPFDKYSIAPPPVSGVTNNEKLGSLQYESKTTIAQTVLLVAWKRTYIVDIRMAVESTKFNYNNRMAIKSDALTENVPLEQSQINPTKDTGILFYSLDHSMLVNSFGYAPHGIDGGVFIEFKILSPSIYIPYHIKFGDCSKAYEFVNCYIMSSGYSQFTNKKNIAFVASISDAYDETGIGTRGFTIGETVIILMDAHIGNFANTQNFTLTHEMGHVWKTHQYEPFRLHVDNDCDSSCSHLRLNHESIDQCCTMVYCDSRLFSTSEFCFACIRNCLRARKNPFDPNIIPSGGMIQEE